MAGTPTDQARWVEIMANAEAIYKQVTDDHDFAKTFLDWLFGRYLKKSR